jgi:1-piperideine-2-carboxylate/1-pyrroline-2-carboxylate reductase [NAD(P)H]
VAAGAWSWARARTLLDVLDDPPNTPGPRVFKSVGHAMFDLAAARVAFPEP